jgi:citrate lyase beta subunit
MPLKYTRVKGKPAVKWGEKGKPYPYTPGNDASKKRAIKKAMAQAAAMGFHGKKK